MAAEHLLTSINRAPELAVVQDFHAKPVSTDVCKVILKESIFDSGIIAGFPVDDDSPEDRIAEC